jgi:hypothetical protein
MTLSKGVKVAMGIDKTGQNRFSFTIDSLGVSFLEFSEIIVFSDSDNPIILNGNQLSRRT